MRVFSLAPVNKLCLQSTWKSLQDQLPDAFHSFSRWRGSGKKACVLVVVVSCLRCQGGVLLDASSNMRLEAGVEA